ncbi:unnamed protein product [Arctia plantaginis]|uniref:Uncharacterized protein n=1 Tax=Arctia plantaginis TaxID=874455 RepID=A0A8S0ZQC2_ARCPL|nr:unnamed protein product [Arctia plantaginis]CAB3238094.1 unnamed protein product [Arctia plantaginis]
MTSERDSEASEVMLESIDELKERLSSMKRLMEERKAAGSGTKELFHGEARSLRGTTMIDGNFLSFVFGASEDMLESIDELKQRLSSMKRLMEERKAAGSGTKELFHGQAKSLRGTTMIDGNFLSFVFGGTFFVIVSVSVYAFYNLYFAVLKKFPSVHTEL